MALNPKSEPPDLGAPPDYAADHPDEHPEDWGWHGEWGRAARIAGYVVAIIMLRDDHRDALQQVGCRLARLFTVGLIVVLIWDFQRRKNAWRK